jgi:tRNA-dihydrouridine synthase
LGWDESTKYVVDAAERLQDVGIEAISIHGRTRKQMYKGDADWSLIAEVKNNPRMKIPVFGNGDINSPEKAVEYKNRYGVDGVMIGRASIGNPWFFNQVKHFVKTGEHLALPSIQERVNVTIEHLKMSVEWKGEIMGINEMKRHYSNYFRGIPDFKPYRTKLVTSMDLQEVYDTLNLVAEKFVDQD